jgi:hypothetical protein
MPTFQMRNQKANNRGIMKIKKRSNLDFMFSFPEKVNFN